MRSGNLLAQLVRGMAGFKPRSPSFESTQFTLCCDIPLLLFTTLWWCLLRRIHCVLLVTVSYNCPSSGSVKDPLLRLQLNPRHNHPPILSFLKATQGSKSLFSFTRSLFGNWTLILGILSAQTFLVITSVLMQLFSWAPKVNGTKSLHIMLPLQPRWRGMDVMYAWILLRVSGRIVTWYHQKGIRTSTSSYGGKNIPYIYTLQIMTYSRLHCWRFLRKISLQVAYFGNLLFLSWLKKSSENSDELFSCFFIVLANSFNQLAYTQWLGAR